MNVQFTQPGRSFKGASSYYLHDKRTGERPTTSERVAWTETRNLATDRPEVATRLMIATAGDADRLKREAGIRASGRKAEKPVMAYSLAWHPSEKVDRAEMMRAANDSLRTLGLERHQALIVAHRDTAHPHVHVIVNRVSPEDGRLATISPKLGRELARDWAHRYEQDRGQIVSPNRAEKMERIEEKRRQHPDPEKRKEHVAAREASPRATTSTRAQQLREAGAAQNERHRQEWAQVAGRYGARKDEIYRDSRTQIKGEIEAHKAENKPAWRDHFAQERRDRRDIARMEASPHGRLVLAIVAARAERAEGSKTSLATLVMANLISKGHRDAVFDRVFERGRQGLSERLQGRLDDRLKPIIERRSTMLEQASQENKRERAELRERQEPEKAAMREAWRELREVSRSAERAAEARTAPEQAREAARTSERAQEAQRAAERAREAQREAKGQERPREAAREPETRPADRFGWLDQQKAAQARQPEQERQNENQDRFGWLDKSRDERAAEQRERAAREREQDRDRDR